jgi:hypothetical protein
VAVARVRGARAAGVVAVTGTVDFALNDNAVAAVTVVTGDEESEKAGNEEEDAIPDVVSNVVQSQLFGNLHDAKRK